MRHQYPTNLAEVVYERLLKDVGSDKESNITVAEIPATPILARIFEIFYFASFHTEEGRFIQLRVAYADPKNSDPDAPSRIRADRWTFTRLNQTINFSVEEAVKLAKAADPWSSALAIFSTPTGELFIWGLIDQRVHFNTFLLREGGGGYDPPGLFEVTTTGIADITVYRGGAILGRLSQGALAESETDVLWVGPISDRLNKSIKQLQRRIRKKVGARIYDAGFWEEGIEDLWKATLCRILIGIQRYRHGGALLFSDEDTDLSAKYSMKYSRVRDAIEALSLYEIAGRHTWDIIHDEFLEEQRKTMPVSLYLDSEIARGDLEDRQAQLTGCVRFVSSLSGVDGLVLIRRDFTIVGFGVEITTQCDLPPLRICSGEIPSNENLKEADPSHFGTRHRSMMRYCWMQPGAVGLVVSQDGYIRAITRVKECVVLWENIMVQQIWERYVKRVKSRYI